MLHFLRLLSVALRCFAVASKANKSLGISLASPRTTSHPKHRTASSGKHHNNSLLIFYNNFVMFKHQISSVCLPVVCRPRVKWVFPLRGKRVGGSECWRGVGNHRIHSFTCGRHASLASRNRLSPCPCRRTGVTAFGGWHANYKKEISKWTPSGMDSFWGVFGKINYFVCGSTFFLRCFLCVSLRWVIPPQSFYCMCVCVLLSPFSVFFKGALNFKKRPFTLHYTTDRHTSGDSPLTALESYTNLHFWRSQHFPLRLRLVFWNIVCSYFCWFRFIFSLASDKKVFTESGKVCFSFILYRFRSVALRLSSGRNRRERVLVVLVPVSNRSTSISFARVLNNFGLRFNKEPT